MSPQGASSDPTSLASLSPQLAGRVIAGVEQDRPDCVTLRLEDGASLVVELRGERLKLSLHAEGAVARPKRNPSHPTARQRDYLDFIKKYMSRYGVAPAEADIERHFMVSAPSVNAMVRTLERRGFITRARDWSGQALPRSIRVVWEG